MFIETKEINLEIYKLLELQSYPVPDLTNVATMGVSVESGNITGIGLIKPTHEAILALDTTRSKKSQVVAMNELIIAGRVLSRRLGIKEWHSFVEPEFAKILTSHFGFSNCKGESLIFKLE